MTHTRTFIFNITRLESYIINKHTHIYDLVIERRQDNSFKMTFSSSSPKLLTGAVLGKMKSDMDKLIDNGSVQLHIRPVLSGSISAELLASEIAASLIAKKPYKSTITKVMDNAMKSGALGIKIEIAGRLGGAEIARREKFLKGRMPTSTIMSGIQYAQKAVKMPYILGLKVLVYSGYVKANTLGIQKIKIY
jgi:small subunit ribosomal protein S3